MSWSSTSSSTTRSGGSGRVGALEHEVPGDVQVGRTVAHQRVQPYVGQRADDHRRGRGDGIAQHARAGDRPIEQLKRHGPVGRVQESAGAPGGSGPAAWERRARSPASRTVLPLMWQFKRLHGFGRHITRPMPRPGTAARLAPPARCSGPGVAIRRVPDTSGAWTSSSSTGRRIRRCGLRPVARVGGRCRRRGGRGVRHRLAPAAGDPARRRARVAARRDAPRAGQHAAQRTAGRGAAVAAGRPAATSTPLIPPPASPTPSCGRRCSSSRRSTARPSC